MNLLEFRKMTPGEKILIILFGRKKEIPSKTTEATRARKCALKRLEINAV
jgi:hypothetical protein